ncbi:MAG: hypothetical protein HYU51_14270 [Candidatus Rokubacteria bacterium]|nr:hypothetical protein [Candidatus Rokubacteria bacterium]
MRCITRHVALAASAGVLAITSVAGAQQPTVSDIALCNQEAHAAVGGSALPRLPGPQPGSETTRHPAARERMPPAPDPVVPPTKTQTDSTGSIVTESPDPLLEGMAADKVDDRDYRIAYRECMRRQLGERRR